MPSKQLYTTGWHREREHGYSRAVRCGDLIFVSGTTGFDYERNVMPEDLADQTRAALANIEGALRHLDSSLRDVVQITTYFTDADEYPVIGQILGEVLAEIRPTNTAILAGFVSTEMKVEISALAVAGAGQ